jgi:DNA polymerase beta
LQLKGVGSGITRRIAEYLKLEDGFDAVDESLRPILQELETIPSIGCVPLSLHHLTTDAVRRPKSALALVKAGCTSVKDLHLPQFQEMLTARQKIGLKYARQLDMRVTRTEAESVVVSPVDQPLLLR